jgi:hypothetical protein
MWYINIVSIMIAVFIETQIVTIAISPNIISLPFRVYMIVTGCILLRCGGAADLRTVTFSRTATCVPVAISRIVSEQPTHKCRKNLSSADWENAINIGLTRSDQESGSDGYSHRISFDTNKLRASHLPC